MRARRGHRFRLTHPPRLLQAFRRGAVKLMIDELGGWVRELLLRPDSAQNGCALCSLLDIRSCPSGRRPLSQLYIFPPSTIIVLSIILTLILTLTLTLTGIIHQPICQTQTSTQPPLATSTTYSAHPPTSVSHRPSHHVWSLRFLSWPGLRPTIPIPSTRLWRWRLSSSAGLRSRLQPTSAISSSTGLLTIPLPRPKLRSTPSPELFRSSSSGRLPARSGGRPIRRLRCLQPTGSPRLLRWPTTAGAATIWLKRRLRSEPGLPSSTGPDWFARCSTISRRQQSPVVPSVH